MNDAANGRRGALPPGVSRATDLQQGLREHDYLAEEPNCGFTPLRIRRKENEPDTAATVV